MEDDLLADQRRHRHVHLLLGSEPGQAGEDELRHFHLQRRAGGGRFVEPAVLPLGPGEEIEQLLRQVLLQDPEQVGGRHQAVLEEDLAERHAAGRRAREAGREVFLAQLALDHHVTAEGLVREVGAAVHDDAVLEENPFPDLAPPHLQHQRVLAQGVSEEQGRDGDLGEAPLLQACDLLQSLWRWDHVGCSSVCRKAGREYIYSVARPGASAPG